MNDFNSIIGLWPSVAEFAVDLGIENSHAHAMKARNAITPRYWPALVNAARRRKFSGVTYEALALIAAKVAA